MKKRITISDIAAEAGVSKATVSRVISNSPKVKEDLRNRILDIMKKNSYVPNQLARGLAGTPTNTIGIVIDELANYFFIEAVEGIDSIVSSSDYAMQISSSRWKKEREIQIVQSLLSSRVDGILISPVSSSSEAIEILQNSGIPFVMINCTHQDKNIAYVGCDNYLGGQKAAELANKLDREQTIIITGYEHQSLSGRVDGFKNTFKDKSRLCHYDNIKTYEEGYDLIPVLEMRNRIREKPTTLFVTNDNVAIGITTCLMNKGISVPEQISVIGYDNIRLASICRVPLTTISQSIRDMGRIAAIELLEMIKNPDKEKPHFLLKPELVIRNSTATA